MFFVFLWLQKVIFKWHFQNIGPRFWIFFNFILNLKKFFLDTFQSNDLLNIIFIQCYLSSNPHPQLWSPMHSYVINVYFAVIQCMHQEMTVVGVWVFLSAQHLTPPLIMTLPSFPLPTFYLLFSLFLSLFFFFFSSLVMASAPSLICLCLQLKVTSIHGCIFNCIFILRYLYFPK